MSKRKNSFTRFIEDIVDDSKDFVDDIIDRARDLETGMKDARLRPHLRFQALVGLFRRGVATHPKTSPSSPDERFPAQASPPGPNRAGPCSAPPLRD